MDVSQWILLLAVATAGAVLGLLAHLAADWLAKSLRPAGFACPPALRARAWLVALCSGAATAGLYWWEVLRLGMVPSAIAGAAPADAFTTSNFPSMLHAQFASHVVLLLLLLMASLNDLDERIVPDLITVPGAILGLVACAIYPWLLPAADNWGAAVGVRQVEFVTLSAPGRWPAELLPGRAGGLAVALAAWLVWSMGLLDRRWIGRRGLRRGVAYFFARIRRSPATRIVLPLALAGSLAISLVWKLADAAHWAGLTSSLAGLFVSGGIVWCVRVAGGWGLQKEGMGFGDVTLMSMVGAFVGWQIGLVAFFVAPFAALVIGLARWVFRKENELPFVPYLSLGVCAVLVRWTAVWDWAYGLFAIGWLVPAAIGVCLVLLALMLAGWRLLKERFFSSSARNTG